ncbi:MAG: hypothetical protein WCG10_05065 [Chlamydiota bacterium]
MATIREIVQHIANGTPYKNSSGYIRGYQMSTGYQLLTQETSTDIIDIISRFICGFSHQSESDLVDSINTENAYSYLAAAKIVDIDTSLDSKMQTTYAIRERILTCCRDQEDKRGKMTMLNAFSIPPLDKDDMDVLLVNELDDNHPLVRESSERDSLKARIYTYCQEKAQIISEALPYVEGLVRDRIKTMEKFSHHIPSKTSVVFREAQGAGELLTLKRLEKFCIKGVEVDKLVQSTDNLKKDLRGRIGTNFTDEQVHLLGLSTFTMLSKVMKATQSHISTFEERSLNSVSTITDLFKDLQVSDMTLEMHDFDGDYEAICLRTLANYQDPNSAKPSMELVERGFKKNRESRMHLLESLKLTDRYECCFARKDNSVDVVDPHSIDSSAGALDREIAETKVSIITEHHVQLFGESLRSFIDKTIEDAFKIAKTNGTD